MMVEAQRPYLKLMQWGLEGAGCVERQYPFWLQTVHPLMLQFQLQLYAEAQLVEDHTALVALDAWIYHTPP